MNSKFLPKIVILFSVFALFVALYNLLENKKIYQTTLGKISSNYVRIGDAIRDTNTPFLKVTEKNAYQWDAIYYRNICDSLYTGSNDKLIYRYAFYPLFPLVWRMSHVNGHGIVLLNYLFFGLAILILSSIFLANSLSQLFFFVLALLLPTSIVYYLPYTESLFILTFSVALIGLIKRKYWLFLVAMVCFSMTRPSAMFLLVVFIITNLVNLWKHKSFLLFLKDSLLMILPIAIGWLFVMLIQYFESYTWAIYVNASGLWPKHPDLHLPVVDWSAEGFGMTTFALFALAIPACIFVIVWGISVALRRVEQAKISLFDGNEGFIKDYMFKASLLYIMGFTLFNILVGGYQLNGFYRYTMATPFFFIILFQLPEKFKSVPAEYKVSGFCILLVSILLFLASVEFAGKIIQFKYWGLYLLILLALLILIESYLSPKVKMWLLLLLLLPCLLWHGYLFNAYLSNAWIFT